MYLVKTPFLVKKIYSNLIWDFSNQNNKTIYLTFDDGPHITATPYVLNVLKQFNAKATFFCIGKNVIEHRSIYERILTEGHTVGNHTHNHLNGYKTNKETYINNVIQAQQHIQSNLFRPPYGKVTRTQAKLIQQLGYKIIMWDILSGDFDTKLSKEKCANNVVSKSTNGSIIVFHDSAKAFDRMQFALPQTLDYFSNLGYNFKAIEM